MHEVCGSMTATQPSPDQKDLDELPRVSVVIPAFQAKDTIERALNSIADQTLAPGEVIVVDDGSDDGTLEVLEGVKSRWPLLNIKIFQQHHKGAGAARNRGVSESKHDYVAFLDADDEWLPEKLRLSMEAIKATQSALVSHDYIRREKDGEEIVVRSCSANYARSRDTYVNLYRKGYIATSGVVAKREAILSAGGFDETLLTAQDFALWLSLLSSPEVTFHIFPGVLVRYYLTDGSISTHTERRLDCTLKIAQKFYSTLNGRPGSPMLSLWYRVLAVHWEAITAYLRNRQILRALGVLIRAPLNLVRLTLKSGRV